MTDQRRREGAKSNHQTWGIWFILQFWKILRSHSETIEPTPLNGRLLLQEGATGAETQDQESAEELSGTVSAALHTLQVHFQYLHLACDAKQQRGEWGSLGSDPENRERPLFHPEVEIHALLGLYSDSAALLHHSTSFPQITIQTTWTTADCGENAQIRSSAWPMPAVVFISFISRHDYYRLNHLYKQVSKGNLLEVSVTISLFQLAI